MEGQYPKRWPSATQRAHRNFWLLLQSVRTLEFILLLSRTLSAKKHIVLKLEWQVGLVEGCTFSVYKYFFFLFHILQILRENACVFKLQMSPSPQVLWSLMKMCLAQWPFHGLHLQMRNVMTGCTTWWPSVIQAKENGILLQIASSTINSQPAISCLVENTNLESMQRMTWAPPNLLNQPSGWFLPKKVRKCLTSKFV